MKSEKEKPIKEKKEKRQKPPKPYMGKYLSNLSKEEQAKLQKRKTILFFISTAFFAIFIFLPIEGNKIVAETNNKLFTGIYLVLILAQICATIYVSYNNFRKYKIRDEVDFYDAPKKGFNFFTFIGFELYTVLHLGLLIYAVGISTLRFGIWGIFGIAVCAAATTLAILARHVMVYAFGSTTFLPPPDAQSEQIGEEGASEDNAQPQLLENETQEEKESTSVEADEKHIKPTQIKKKTNGADKDYSRRRRR